MEKSDLIGWAEFHRRIETEWFSALTEGSNPNLNPLAHRLKDISNLAFNLKFFGYELARSLAEGLGPSALSAPVHVGLTCKPSTQADLESDWALYWCQQLKAAPVFHRKLWELVYVLQALHEAGCLREGSRGLGFGCGQEPLPSYFASIGVTVLATDLESSARAAEGWAATGQHADSIESAYKPDLVDREKFDRHVQFRSVDMNDFPSDLNDFDFCWSICSLEHLGSIDRGLEFVKRSLDTLRPGGVAVHTTEFNFSNDAETIDNWPTVLFQRRHFLALHSALTAAGHAVPTLDFDVGNKPLDRFIDVPPYLHDWNDVYRKYWGHLANHMKLSVDGFPTTCFGLIIQKRI